MHLAHKRCPHWNCGTQTPSTPCYAFSLDRMRQFETNPLTIFAVALTPCTNMGCSGSKPNVTVEDGLRMEWQDLFDTLGICESDLDDETFQRDMVRIMSCA